MRPDAYSTPLRGRVRAERRRGGRVTCPLPLGSSFGRVLDLSSHGARTLCGWRGMLWRPRGVMNLRFAGRDGALEVRARAVEIGRHHGRREARFELVELSERQLALLRHLAGLLIVPGAANELAQRSGRGR